MPHRLSTSLLLLLLMTSIGHAGGVPSTEPFIRGDVTRNGFVELNDAIVSAQSIFGLSALDCDDAVDVNDDGLLDVADVVSIVAYLFLAGPTPAAPFPHCGPDLTDSDSLDCSAPPDVCAEPTTMFVLNAPSRVGAGNDWVSRATVYPDGTALFQPLLPADGSWNAITQIEVEQGLLAVAQTVGPAMSRISTVDAETGEILQQLDGIVGEIVGLAVSASQFAYFLVQTDTPSIELHRIPLLDSLPAAGMFPPTITWTAPGAYEVRGMSTAIYGGLVYFGASTPTESGVFIHDDSQGITELVFPIANFERFKFNPIAPSYTFVTTQGGTSLDIDVLYPTYPETEWASGSFSEAPNVGDFRNWGGKFFIPIPSRDEVRIVDPFLDTALPSWTNGDGLHYPVDVAIERFGWGL